MAYAKFDPDKSDMLATAIKYNGNIMALSRHYNVSPETIYQYTYRDPIGKHIIDQVRQLNTETEIDSAEHVIRYHMSNYKTNGALSLRAAEKVIDKKGHARGWKDKVEALENISEELQSQFNLLMKQMTDMRKEKNNENMQKM